MLINSAVASSSGAIASLPSSPASGQIYYPEDSLYDFLRYNGSSWDYFYHGRKVTRFDPTSYALVNNGDGHASVSTQTNGVTTLLVTSNGAADSLHSYEVATPATPWTRTWRVKHQIFDQTFNGAGLILRETGTGKYITFGFVTEHPGTINIPYLEVAKWNSSSSFNALGSNQLQLGAVAGNEVVLRIADNGTTLTWSWSIDNGVSFQVLASANRSSFFTTAPNSMGIYCNPNNQTGSWAVSITAISVD
jgi:hypothetical protein